MQPNLTQIISLAEQVASAFGLSLVDVKVGQQGRNRTLEVTIYKPGARISLEDCEQVSRKLDELLEEQTPPILDGAFMLEVQSPGIDRKLSSEREFRLFTGQLVEVKTKQKVEGLGSAFNGRLAGFQNEQLIIDKPQKMTDRPKNKKTKIAPTEQAPDSVSLEMSNVIQVRLVPEEPSGSDEKTTAI
jgi:ribosome maturation factor RimP